MTNLCGALFVLVWFRYLWVCDSSAHTNFRNAYYKGFFVLASYITIYAY